MNQSLLLEIQKFAMGKNLYHREDPAEGNLFNIDHKKIFTLAFCFLILLCFAAIQLVKIALKLLEELPVLRDCIFDYFSMVIDAYISSYIKQDVSSKHPAKTKLNINITHISCRKMHRSMSLTKGLFQ